jgi:hypothetical protein
MIINKSTIFGLDKKEYLFIKKTILDDLVLSIMDGSYKPIMYCPCCFDDLNLNQQTVSLVCLKEYGELLENNFIDSYLITNTTLEIASKIKVEESVYDYFINDLFEEGEEKCLYLGNRFIRYKIYNKILFFVLCKLDNNDYEYVMQAFYIDNKDSHSLFQILKSDTESDLKQDIEDFMRLLIFLKKGDIEITFVKGNKTSKEAPFHINRSGTPLTIVDSSWNKISIRAEAFDVSGHFRLQVCGEGRKERKLTWINPFKKSGYVRTGRGAKIINNQI